MKLTLAQLNPTVGDLDGNFRRMSEIYHNAARTGADAVIFPELAACGYPPDDLILRPPFLAALETAQQRFIASTGKTAVVFGTVIRREGKSYNAAIAAANGKVIETITKQALPNYGVFDEKRWFSAGAESQPVEIAGRKIGILICEDIWESAEHGQHLQSEGAEMLIVINASPFSAENVGERRAMAVRQARVANLPLLYVNQWGGQDELVFDGRSFVLNAEGEPVLQMSAWQEEIQEIAFPSLKEKGGDFSPLDPAQEMYHGAVLGLRDYIRKNGFQKVILGLSGGVDSALVAVMAADALGAQNVDTYMLASPYTSGESREDARAVAQKLGCRHQDLNITAPMQAVSEMFAGEKLSAISQENIQSRLRGLALMALSNTSGALLLTTGNKSEMATGYATLYGDMCGAFNPLKDIYKTRIYELCRWRNQHVPAGSEFKGLDLIPERILTKAPTAELKPGQRDQDTLPPYDVLDRILQGLIENEMSPAAIAAETGYDIDLVQKVWKMCLTAEYKRFQSAPGVKLTARAFGRDRRYPLTNKNII